MLKQDRDDDRRRRTRAKVKAGTALAGHVHRAEIEALIRSDDSAGESVSARQAAPRTRRHGR